MNPFANKGVMMPNSFGLATFCVLFAAMRVEAQRELSPRVVKAVAPPYDEVLYLANVQGRVVLRATVEPSGEVSDAKVIEAFWQREEWFVAYAKRWKFEPLKEPKLVDIVFDFKMIPLHVPEEDVGTTFFPPSRVEIRSRERPPLSFHR